MLPSLKSLEGYSISATDGVIGQVRDFYFDDDAWSSAISSWRRTGGIRINGY
jgi:hypothetical protein